MALRVLVPQAVSILAPAATVPCTQTSATYRCHCPLQQRQHHSAVPVSQDDTAWPYEARTKLSYRGARPDGGVGKQIATLQSAQHTPSRNRAARCDTCQGDSDS